MHQELIFPLTIFLPCPAPFSPRAWCGNTLQEWCLRVRKMLRGQMCSQKIKAEASAKMDVEEVLSQKTKKNQNTQTNKNNKNNKTNKRNKNKRTKTKQTKPPTNTEHAQLVSSFFHTQWNQPAGTPRLHLEKEERWMAAHNQNRIVVLVSMFPTTSVSKVKGWEKRRCPWFQICDSDVFSAVFQLFFNEYCYWWSALGF